MAPAAPEPGSAPGPTRGPLSSEHESDPVAPLLGHGPPLGEAVPRTAGAGATAVDSGAETVSANPPFVGPRPPAVPRAGLGEPMRSLPPTASSWDITTLSRAQQLRTRSLIQSQMASRALTGGPFRPTPPSMLAPTESSPPGGAPVPDPVFAGMPLASAPLVPIEPALAGVGPAELPRASAEHAPLLSGDPRFGPEAAAPGPARSGPPVEGTRVRTTIGQRHGVDLMNVPVDRTAEGASEAHRLRARAFTSDRAIVIPSSAGSLEAGPGEALLAHELTHAAQRARFGPHLPMESAPEGQRLEAQALGTEMTFRTGATTGPPSSRPGLSSRRSEPGGADDRGPSTEAGAALPLAATSNGPDTESLALSILDKMSSLTTAAPPGGTSAVFTPSWSSAPAAAPSAGAGGIQRADGDVEVAATLLPAPAPTPDAHAVPSATRPSDEDLSNLSRWLYPLIRYRLKGELREDRERAGLLTDHYRRW